jgi:hypothetical protein
MNADEVVTTHRSVRAVLFLKWLMFVVEIFLLWVLCNTLFLVPGPYAGERGLIIAVTAPLAAAVAWTSGRLFQSSSTNESASLGKILSSPPVVICIFVFCVASIVMAVSVLATS